MPEPLKNPRIVFVIGTIAPYTHRLYEALGAALGGQLTVLCCAEIEPTRSWIIGPARNYRRIVLPGLRIHRSDLQNIYLNPFVLWHLFRLKPDITVIGSFSPTMLLTALWSIITGTRLAVSTDGVPSTDPGSRSFIHRLVRRLVIPRADIGIGASRESLDLLRHYGLPVTAATALSPVLPAWDFTGPSPAFSERRYDLFFCGRLDERKGIPFLIETLEHCVSRGYRPSLRVAGEGPLRPLLEQAVERLGLAVHFDGYLQTHQLAEAFSSAKLFVFPTHFDPWGLVANEALQCGTPVLASPHAASSRSLVMPHGAGLVMGLDAAQWGDAILRLLEDQPGWTLLHKNALKASGTTSLERSVSSHLAAYQHPVG